MVPGPIRTCAGCRKKRPQAELLRVARDVHGAVSVDRSGLGGRRPGRGAYVCPEVSCVEAALDSGRVARGLRVRGGLPEGLKNELLRYATAKGSNGQAKGSRGR
ncbi:MAG: YlxR family protein [Actinomycetota bacterium]